MKRHENDTAADTSAKTPKFENPLAVIGGLLMASGGAMHVVTQTSEGVQIAFTILATAMPFLVLLFIVRLELLRVRASAVRQPRDRELLQLQKKAKAPQLAIASKPARRKRGARKRVTAQA